jgi:uncharacterized Tic20 family protein
VSDEPSGRGAVGRDGDGVLDPAGAATLLERSTQRAQRQFNVWPPLLLLTGAVLFPFAFGVVWRSVRDQHPYVGPSGGALAVFYVVIIVWVIAVSATVRRATSGVGGRSARQRKVEGYGFAAMLIAVYVFQGALLHAGASHAIVYGVYPITAPFIFLGSASAITAAAREDWRAVRVAAPLVATALAAAFTGPVVSWLVVGVGISVVLAGLAVAQLRQRRGKATA